MSDNTIFVQIASYRDPELRNTIKDLLDNADNPDNFHISIAWQHAEEDTWDHLDDYLEDPRFTIIDIPYKDAKGACWARWRLQQEYKQEKYTLQLDSHMRFTKGFDTTLIEELEKLREKGHNKPMLTGYIPHFDPANDPESRQQVPWYMHYDRISPDGNVHFMPATIDNFMEYDSPIPARFYSAHFCFTDGKFVEEVPHDPDLYFHGEEITISVRAFTHGYDMFQPHRVWIWHEYTRPNKKKHWDDSEDWVTRNKHAHYRTRRILGIDGEGCTPCMMKNWYPYVPGTVRTVADYEKYSGIRFSDRSVQQYTLDKGMAPNPEVEDYDNSFIKRFKHCIDIHKSELKEDDYEFWCIAFETEQGEPISRVDAYEEEIKQLLATQDDWIKVWREYDGDLPKQVVVWPFSKTKGWCDRIVRKLE